jgi:glycosyltransferase involved in cell wall biosynthesis
VEQMMGKATKPDAETSMINIKPEIFGIYMGLLPLFLALKLRKRCELLINTNGDVLLVEADIVYMHYPTFALAKENPINVKYSKNLFWKAYFIPYEKIQQSLVKKFLSGLILTNSNFSRKEIKKLIGKDAMVVYPPVEVKKFSVASKKVERENIIISCGRYSPEKNYKFILKVAERLKRKVIFVVVGASSGKISREYYEKLMKIKKEKQLENVKLLKNVNLIRLLELYGKSKIYLHAMRYEHFGISIVEAMAAGLVPIVHMSGGPWEDILMSQQGTYGFSYKTSEEAAWLIEELIDNDILRKEIVSRNSLYVHAYDEQRFKDNMLKVIYQHYACF